MDKIGRSRKCRRVRCSAVPSLWIPFPRDLASSSTPRDVCRAQKYLTLTSHHLDQHILILCPFTPQLQRTVPIHPQSWISHHTSHPLPKPRASLLPTTTPPPREPLPTLGAPSLQPMRAVLHRYNTPSHSEDGMALMVKTAAGALGRLLAWPLLPPEEACLGRTQPKSASSIPVWESGSTTRLAWHI